MSSAVRDDPDLWEDVKREVLRGSKGGNPGQWSARKAQLAVRLYQERGGGYVGPKRADNSLAKWTREEWRTQSGLPSLVTGERYLPRKAIEELSQAEYDATSKRKRAGMARGEQFVPQPPGVREKTRKHRMPMRSQAQRRYLWAVMPDVARKLEDETRRGAKLPEHVQAEEFTRLVRESKPRGARYTFRNRPVVLERFLLERADMLTIAELAKIKRLAPGESVSLGSGVLRRLG